MKGYKINYASNVITVTKKFVEDAGVINSAAFNEMKELRTMGMLIQIKEAKAHRTPKITYRQMIRYIECVENSAHYMARFEAVRAEAQTKRNTYHRVLQWFIQTFPNFYAMPEFNADNEVIVTPCDYLSEDTAA